MSIEKIKLFHYPATRSARVKWVLHELLGDDFEVELVSLYDGVQYSDEYMKKNPNHCVPTLEMTNNDGETFTMFESGAMVALLTDAFPEKNLAPPADELSFARADYLQMLHFGVSSIDMMLWQIRVHEHLLSEEEGDPRTIERYRKKFVDEVDPQLQSRLETSPYICGEEFTSADCVIGHDVLWARAYGLCTGEIYSQYLSRISKRPAFLSAFSDAHEFTVEVPEGKMITGIFTG